MGPFSASRSLSGTRSFLCTHEAIAVVGSQSAQCGGRQICSWIKAVTPSWQLIRGSVRKHSKWASCILSQLRRCLRDLGQDQGCSGFFAEACSHAV